MAEHVPGEGLELMVDEYAHEPSLGAQMRALQAILPYLLAEIESAKAEVHDVARLVQIVSAPKETPPGLPVPRHRHAKPRERPPWLKVYPGGLAAVLVPAALLAHGPLMVSVPGLLRGALRAWRSHRALMAVSVALLGVASAAGGSSAANILDVPPPLPAVRVHHHRGRQYRPDADNDAPVPGTRG